MSAEHRRRYRLGSGITVEFVFRPDQARKGEVSTVALACEWDQAPPRFRPGNARNKFLRAYRRARADFLEDVAQLIGGRIEALLWTVMHSGGAPGERQLRGHPRLRWQSATPCSLPALHRMIPGETFQKAMRDAEQIQTHDRVRSPDFWAAQAGR